MILEFRPEEFNKFVTTDLENKVFGVFSIGILSHHNSFFFFHVLDDEAME